MNYYFLLFFYDDGSKPILIDGFSRARMHFDLGKKTILAYVLAKTATTEATLASKPVIQMFEAPDFDSTGVKLTKAQSEFFKNSVVRDENGNLLRVYHGTTEEFTTFKHMKPSNFKTYGMGFYFTPSRADAEFYAGMNQSNAQGPIKATGKILEVYLNITNPIDYSNWRTAHTKIAKFAGLTKDDPINSNLIEDYHNMLRQTENKDGIVVKNKKHSFWNYRNI